MDSKKCCKMMTLLLPWLLLAGCDFNPLSPNNQTTGDPVGAATGAAIGAGSMALLRAPGPLIALAAVGGAGVGYYVTSLSFDSGGVKHAGGEVYTLGQYATINIPSYRLFDPGSDELLPDVAPILKSAFEVLQRYPENNVLISGNTSGFSTDKYDQKLSEDRAKAVAAYLWSQGISSFHNNDLKRRKLTYVGYGSYFPVANNIRAKGINQNNRIQITSYPSSEQLNIGKREKLFNNIGGLDEHEQVEVSERAQDYDFSREFPNYDTDEMSGRPKPDLKQKTHSPFHITHDFKNEIPHRNLKGEMD